MNQFLDTEWCSAESFLPPRARLCGELQKLLTLALESYVRNGARDTSEWRDSRMRKNTEMNARTENACTRRPVWRNACVKKFTSALTFVMSGMLRSTISTHTALLTAYTDTSASTAHSALVDTNGRMRLMARTRDITMVLVLVVVIPGSEK